MAARIEERAGKKLCVRNLRDPDVQEWREQALGGDDGLAPTLFEVEDGEIRAWKGWRIGWVLSRAIGPAATWQVMQALGEVGAAPETAEAAFGDPLPEDAGEAVLGMDHG